mmetsp:Transcript_19965/g.61528  ORF Transcript_19965/g.61528 Transcript_19965/m.61528 type:complete len:113 (+) Transcript_19965:133-471(+)
MALGNNASAPVSSCEWLDGVPDPRIRAVVQRPGDVLFFGQGVPHATCALEESWGVGSQLGYYPTAFANLTRDPSKQFDRRAAHCRWLAHSWTHMRTRRRERAPGSSRGRGIG